MTKTHIKSALVGAVAVILVMAVAALPYLLVKAVSNANERYEQGQKAMIEKHKLENRGAL